MPQLRSIQKALALIEEQLASPLPLQAIARHAGMSLWHFQRTFTAMVGEPAGSYLRRRRLAEAAHTLRTTNRTILDVALEFQFESHEAFTRAFKAELQLPPSQWRKNPRSPAGLRPIHLSLLTLQQRYRHMQQTPEIVTLPARTFTGLQARFISATSSAANNLEVIPKLWAEFGPRIRELAPVFIEDASYGLVDCPESRGEEPRRPDEALYLAAIAVAHDRHRPRGMVSWQSPGGMFAKFVHRGPASGIGALMGYIYGQWLASGSYERTAGPDIERYDARFDPESADSVFEIYIPVQPRKSGAPADPKAPVRRQPEDRA